MIGGRIQILYSVVYLTPFSEEKLVMMVFYIHMVNSNITLNIYLSALNTKTQHKHICFLLKTGNRKDKIICLCIYEGVNNFSGKKHNKTY